MKPRDPWEILTPDDLLDWWQALDNDEQEQAYAEKLLNGENDEHQ